MTWLDLPPLTMEALGLVAAMVGVAEQMIEEGHFPPPAVGLLLPEGAPLIYPARDEAEIGEVCRVARERGARLAVTVTTGRRLEPDGRPEARGLLVAICSPAGVTVRGREFSFDGEGRFRGWGAPIAGRPAWVAVDPWRETRAPPRAAPPGVAHA